MAVPNDDPTNNNGDNDDRLSQLPDHVLLLVLDRLRDDERLLARTCILSKRWRTLPLMLSRLKITVASFLPAASRNSTLPVRCLHQATSKFTDALRFFLAGGQRDIDTLILQFYLTKHRHRLHEIGRLVSAAVARGEVRRLEVVLDTAGDDARGYARRFTRLFRAAPAGVLGSCLGRLALRNLCFPRASDIEGVIAECEALEALHLTCCWFVSRSALRIDLAPRSRIRELWLTGCGVERVDVVRAPGLVELRCKTWFSEACPVTFGPDSAPSLKHMTLINRSKPMQVSFKLSKLLENANPLEYLYLDFVIDKIWVEPESPRNLGAAFSKLKMLHVNIFAGADISWTMFLIKAAPLLEHVDIRVCPEPICREHDGGGDTEDVEWEAASDHFEHRHLQTFKIRGGFDADEDLRFMRLVMERAVSLKLLVLDARIPCAACVAAKQQDPSIVLSSFPEDKDGVDAFVRQLKDGVPTSARIIIYCSSAQMFEY